MKTPEVYENALTEAEAHVCDAVAQILGKTVGTNIFIGLLPSKTDVILVEMAELQMMEDATFAQNLQTFCFRANVSFRYSTREKIQQDAMLLMRSLRSVDLNETNLAVLRIAGNGISGISVVGYFDDNAQEEREAFSGTVSLDVVFDAGMPPNEG
jgi:hypothetical protein